MYNTGMKGTIAVDKTEKVGITLPKSILQRIDKVRGDIPRSTYIRRAVEIYLKQGKGRWKTAPSSTVGGGNWIFEKIKLIDGWIGA